MHQTIQTSNKINKNKSLFKSKNKVTFSFSNSNNHLDDFSPLFDASEQDNSQKEEFTVEIEAIGDNRLFFPRK